MRSNRNWRPCVAIKRSRRSFDGVDCRSNESAWKRRMKHAANGLFSPGGSVSPEIDALLAKDDMLGALKACDQLLAQRSRWHMQVLQLKGQTLLKLGKHKRAKGCLYVSRLSDIDLKVLEKLVAQAMKGQAVKIQPKPRVSPKAKAPAAGHRIFRMAFSRVYPLLVAKVERKGRTVDELRQVICWLTGYSAADLDRHLERGTDFETFFAGAPRPNPARGLITGSVCGVRIEEITETTMREIRYLDKLVDELAKGRPMEKVLRTHV